MENNYQFPDMVRAFPYVENGLDKLACITC